MGVKLMRLRERIRELEAELEKERLANRILRSPVYGGAEAGMTDLAEKAVEIAEKAKASAEKAEHDGEVARKNAIAILERLKEAEARVAELETEVKKEYERAEYNAMCVAKNVEHGWSGKHKAREREGC